jgi:hypothetical protein
MEGIPPGNRLCAVMTYAGGLAQPEGPIPSLDLRALSTIELHRPTRAVLDALVEGIDVVPSGDGDPAAGVCTRWCDDEDTARSAFTFGPLGLTAHARWARDAPVYAFTAWGRLLRLRSDTTCAPR